MIERWASPRAIVNGPAASPTFPVPTALGVGGFFFPLAVLWIGSALGLLSTLIAGQYSEVGRGLVWFVVAHIFVFPVGMIFFLFVMVAALPVWGLWLTIRRTLDAQLDDVELATHAGATLGYLLPLAYVEFMSQGMSLGREAFAFALLTSVATPLGQYAGAWSQWPLRERKPPDLKWQFGIRQLLVATGWIAGGLGAMKLLGMLTPLHLSLLGGWLLYQWGVARVVFFLCRRRAAKRRGNVSEGTSK